MSNIVKLFESTQTGAPSLSGTAGSLIALLDAVLVNGFNLVSLDSITRSGSVATANCAAGHGKREHDVVMHAGAVETEYNGEFRIYDVTATSYKFDVTGTPTTPATGSPTSKVAPLGWTKAFSGTNKAAYKSSEVTSTQLYLRVDDTSDKYASVSGYESMTDIDTGSGVFALPVSVWYKSTTANSTLRNWLIGGDGQLFYLFTSWDASGLYAGACFGDILTYKPGDAFNCISIADVSSGASNLGAGSNYFMTFGATTGRIMARAYSQLGGSIAFSSDAGQIASLPAYPNPTDNGVLLGVIHVRETTSNAVRGLMPGIYRPLHSVSGMPAHGTIIDNIPAAPDKRFLIVGAASSGGGSAPIVLDVTGPWR